MAGSRKWTDGNRVDRSASDELCPLALRKDQATAICFSTGRVSAVCRTVGFRTVMPDMSAFASSSADGMGKYAPVFCASAVSKSGGCGFF